MNVTEKCYDPGLLFEEGESGNKRWVLYGQQNQHYREIFVDKNTFDVTLGPERLWKETCDHENKAGVWVEGCLLYTSCRHEIRNNLCSRAYGIHGVLVQLSG